CPLGDRRPGGVRLEAAAAAAALADAPAPVHGDVAELAAVAGAPADDAPVEDHAASDAGRDGEVEHVQRAAAGAEAVLPRSRGGRVVVEHRGNGELRGRKLD